MPPMPVLQDLWQTFLACPLADYPCQLILSILLVIVFLLWRRAAGRARTNAAVNKVLLQAYTDAYNQQRALTTFYHSADPLLALPRGPKK